MTTTSPVGGRNAWRLLVVLVAAVGCTKVNEQPMAPAPTTPPPLLRAKQARRAPTPHDNRWGTPLSTSVAVKAPDAAPAVIDTLNGDPQGLHQDDLQRSLDAAMPKLASCFEGATGSINVALSFDAEPTGQAGNVAIAGGPPGAERCVSSTLAGLRLPKFSGRSVPVHFPLSIQKSTQPAQPSSGTTSPPGPPSAPRPNSKAPSIFVNP